MGGRGSAGAAYSTPPDTLARLRALLLKGKKGGGWKVEERRGKGDG